jgi:hypothetical protein
MERQYSTGLSVIEPNIVTYTSAINAWANSKQQDSAERAEALLNRMDSHYREGNEALKPTVLTYNTGKHVQNKTRQHRFFGNFEFFPIDTFFFS